MKIAYDRAKHDRNLRQRGFGFDHAALILDGPTIERPDRRRTYGEERIIAVGGVGSDVLAVVYTDRGESRRIISARRANQKERRLWQSPE
ncbi:MAG: BrnT family toxin [Bauldia sp.]